MSRKYYNGSFQNVFSFKHIIIDDGGLSVDVSYLWFGTLQSAV